MENATNTPEVYTIPAYRMGEFIERFTKMNRKAKKLGCPPVSYTIIGETEIKVQRPTEEDVFFGQKGKVYTIPAKLVTVAGVTPQVEGFQLLARIEYLSDSKSKLFHTVPGTNVKVDERFRALSAGVCEHCNTARLRRDTFVVRNVETGEQKQIGRNCLADFIGGRSPEAVANWASYLDLFDKLGGGRDEEEGWGNFRGYFVDKADTLAVLTLTAAYIKRFGWVPRSQAEFNTPTSAKVGRHFQSTRGRDEGELREMREIAEAIAANPEYKARAERVIAWIKNDLAPVAKSDYELNLCTLVVGELTESRHLGIVCSAVAAYERAQNREIEYAKRKADLKKSQFVGAVKERLRNVEATVQFVRSMSGTFGPVTLVKFLDNSGNLLTWFASSGLDYTVGTKVVLTATVKGHKEYEGVKETSLTRAKVEVKGQA